MVGYSTRLGPEFLKAFRAFCKKERRTQAYVIEDVIGRHIGFGCVAEAVPEAVPEVPAVKDTSPVPVVQQQDGKPADHVWVVKPYWLKEKEGRESMCSGKPAAAETRQGVINKTATGFVQPDPAKKAAALRAMEDASNQRTDTRVFDDSDAQTA